MASGALAPETSSEAAPGGVVGAVQTCPRGGMGLMPHLSNIGGVGRMPTRPMELFPSKNPVGFT